MINPFQKNKISLKIPSLISPKIDTKPNIVKVYSNYFPDNRLKTSHKSILTLCPIHGERNPSFALYKETNTYYCFACGATGDSFKLIMELENCDFRDALNIAKLNNFYD